MSNSNPLAEFGPLSRSFAQAWAKEFLEKAGEVGGWEAAGGAEVMCYDLEGLFASETALNLRRCLRSCSIIDVMAAHLEELRPQLLAEAPSKSSSSSSGAAPVKGTHPEALSEEELSALSARINAYESTEAAAASNSNSNSNSNGSGPRGLHNIMFNWLDSQLEELVLNNISRNVFVPKPKMTKREQKKLTVLLARRAKNRDKKAGKSGDKPGRGRPPKDESLKRRKAEDGSTGKSPGRKRKLDAMEGGVPSPRGRKPNAGGTKEPKVRKPRGSAKRANVSGVVYDSAGRVISANTSSDKVILEGDPAIATVLPLSLTKLMLKYQNMKADPNFDASTSNASISEAFSSLLDSLCHAGVLSEASAIRWEKVWAESCNVDLIKSAHLENTIPKSFSVDKLFLGDEAKDIDSKFMDIRQAVELSLCTQDTVVNKSTIKNSSSASNECMNSIQERIEATRQSFFEKQRHAASQFVSTWAPAIEANDSSSKDSSKFLPQSINRIENPFEQAGLNSESLEWMVYSKNAAQMYSKFGQDTSKRVSEKDFDHPFVNKSSFYYGTVSLKDAVPNSILSEMEGKTISQIASSTEEPGIAVDDFTTIDRINRNIEPVSKANASYVDKASKLIENGHNVIIVDKTDIESKEKNSLHKCEIVCDMITTQLSTLDSKLLVNSIMPDINSKKAFGPILILVKIGEIARWEDYIRKRMSGYEIVSYYGCETDREIIRGYLTPENLYTQYGAGHIILTHYEAFIVDLHFWKDITWQQIVLDEAWGLFSKQNRYETVFQAFSLVKSMSKIFISSSICHSTESRLCLPDLFSALSVVLPEVMNLFLNENINQLSQEASVFQHMRRLLSGFTVVIDPEFSNYIRSGKLSDSLSGFRKHFSISENVSFDQVVSDLLSWMEWNGVKRELGASSNTLICDICPISFTDSFNDIELDKELDVVNFQYVGIGGHSVRRSSYSTVAVVEKLPGRGRGRPAGERGPVGRPRGKAGKKKTDAEGDASGEVDATAESQKGDDGNMDVEEGMVGNSSSDLARTDGANEEDENALPNEDDESDEENGDENGDMDDEDGNGEDQKENKDDVAESDEESEIGEEEDNGNARDNSQENEEEDDDEDSSDEENDDEDEETDSEDEMAGNNLNNAEEDDDSECDASSPSNKKARLDVSSGLTRSDSDMTPLISTSEHEAEGDVDGDGDGDADGGDDMKSSEQANRADMDAENEEKKLQERQKSLIRKGNKFYAYITVPGRHRFLGIFDDEMSASLAFDVAYKQRAEEAEFILESKKKRQQPKNSEKEEKKRGPKKGDEALEYAEKQWENKIIMARRKSKSKSVSRLDLEDLMFLLDEKLMFRDIYGMMSPQLSAGQSIREWVSSSGNPPSAIAFLMGPQNFSAIVTCQSCIIGRASQSTTNIWNSMGVDSKTEESPINGVNISGENGEVLHIGDDLSIDTRHAAINWNAKKATFEIKCISKLGIYVDGKKLSPSDGSVAIQTKSVIQVGSSIFYFMLPIDPPARGSVSPFQHKCYIVRSLLAYLEFRDGLTYADKVNQQPRCFSIALDDSANFPTDVNLTVQSLTADHVLRLQDIAISEGFEPEAKTPKSSAKAGFVEDCPKKHSEDASEGSFQSDDEDFGLDIFDTPVHDDEQEEAVAIEKPKKVKMEKASVKIEKKENPAKTTENQAPKQRGRKRKTEEVPDLGDISPDARVRKLEAPIPDLKEIVVMSQSPKEPIIRSGFASAYQIMTQGTRQNVSKSSSE